MRALDQKFLDNCPSEFKPTLYHCYVEDTFVFFAVGRKLISSCLIVITVMKISIFAAELANEIKLQFLDALITLNNKLLH